MSMAECIYTVTSFGKLLLSLCILCVAAGCSNEPGPAQLSERPPVSATHAINVRSEIYNDNQQLEARLECPAGESLSISFDCPKHSAKAIESLVVQVIMRRDNGKETIMNSCALAVVPVDSSDIVRVEGTIAVPKVPGRYLLFAANPSGETLLNRELVVSAN